MIYIVLGPPSVGKGTIAKKLSIKLGIPHISIGSLIRSDENIYNKYIVNMEKGILLPDNAVKELLEERLNKEDAKAGFILDGYPRNLNQVKHLDEILIKRNLSLTKVFLFEATEQEIYNRALNRKICIECDKIYGLEKNGIIPNVCEKCGKKLIKRTDDNIESIKRRLNIYHEQICPIIEYYKEKGVVDVIDATGKPDKVLERVKL